MARPHGRKIFEVRKAELLEGVQRSPYQSDKDLAQKMGVSTRYVQTILGSLKSEGAIDIVRRRYKPADSGWCNERKIIVTEK